MKTNKTCQKCKKSEKGRFWTKKSYKYNIFFKFNCVFGVKSAKELAKNISKSFLLFQGFN